jgi:hypothetical protein
MPKTDSREKAPTEIRQLLDWVSGMGSREPRLTTLVFSAFRDGRGLGIS